MTKTGKSSINAKNKLPLWDSTNILNSVVENSVFSDFLRELTVKYSYQPDQISTNVKSNEFEIGLGCAKADIVVWKNVEDKENNSAPFIIVQGKIQEGLRLEDYFEGISFFHQQNATILVTLNESQTNFYKFVYKEESKRKDFVAIEELPNFSEFDNQEKLDKTLDKDEEFKRKEFKDRLFSCHNVIRNNDKFSPEMAFDEISKVMFVKIHLEQTDRKTFTASEFQRRKNNYLESLGQERQYFALLSGIARANQRIRKV